MGPWNSRIARYVEFCEVFLGRRFKSEVQQGSIDGMAE